MNTVLTQINYILKQLIRRNEKAVLDLIFLKMLINPQQIGPVAGNPTTAQTLSAHVSYQ